MEYDEKKIKVERNWDKEKLDNLNRLNMGQLYRKLEEENKFEGSMRANGLIFNLKKMTIMKIILLLDGKATDLELVEEAYPILKAKMMKWTKKETLERLNLEYDIPFSDHEMRYCRKEEIVNLYILLEYYTQ